MELTLTTDKAAPVKPAVLKEIAEALCKHLPQKGKFDAFIACAAMPKMRFLNRTWRGKDKATNVLSYPQFEPDELKLAIRKQAPRSSLHLGDVVLCLPYIKAEARGMKKPVNHHVTHLIVHGVLHLLGYDHVHGRKADAMEKLERAILADLAIPDPYRITPKIVPTRKAAKVKSQR